MSHASVAASVRQDKELYPERYCVEPKCLYRTDERYCPKHWRSEQLSTQKEWDEAAALVQDMEE